MPAKRDSRPPRSKRRDHDAPEGREAAEGAESPERAGRPAPEAQEGPGTVRIIGGKHRGRTLVYSGDVRTRPMKDRVRESLFNLVSTFCEGRVAIDLFAGTGALGLEAISRGCSQAILLEKHLPTSITISKNVESLHEKEACEVCFADTFLWVRRAMEKLHPEVAGEGVAPAPRKVIPGQASNIRFLQNGLPWLIFCSPPYEFYLSRGRHGCPRAGTLECRPRSKRASDRMRYSRESDRAVARPDTRQRQLGHPRLSPRSHRHLAERICRVAPRRPFPLLWATCPSLGSTGS